MEQLGYINDLKTKLNRLKDQVWRAARIVVDVSLHTKRMSIEKAVDYIVENALLEKESAETEVRRYTQTPTQPMSYLIGKLEILKIVNEYKEKHGENFDLKEFHHKLLSYGTILPPSTYKRNFVN
ncbi:hypothetical protein CDO51_07070 [Natranaerobius trueperi]|uniref:Uncharacterized protein n=2 Tax=Natranaerobius trueperi TaxID=759412 RepID=A0A226C025_9FIRM|nr:hypothetical protein CDO51_07070 [Natranaerobius trueperi]